MNLLPFAIGIFKDHWKAIAIGLAFSALALWGWRVDGLRAHYKARAAMEKAAHDQTVQNYRSAQEAAQVAFAAKIQAIQLRNERLNDEADNRAADLRSDYAERVRRLPKAAACPARSAGLPEADLPEGNNGSSPDTVVLARTDALICGENTSRLQAAHDWAVNMGGE